MQIQVMLTMRRNFAMRKRPHGRRPFRHLESTSQAGRAGLFLTRWKACDISCPMELECQAALINRMRPRMAYDGCTSFVSWLRVSMTDGQRNLTRCAFRYGTPANSTEEDLGLSKAFSGGYPVGSRLQVWTVGTNQCIVGVDSMSELIAKENRMCGHSDGFLFRKIPCGPWTFIWLLVGLSLTSVPFILLALRCRLRDNGLMLLESEEDV